MLNYQVVKCSFEYLLRTKFIMNLDIFYILHVRSCFTSNNKKISGVKITKCMNVQVITFGRFSLYLCTSYNFFNSAVTYSTKHGNIISIYK